MRRRTLPTCFPQIHKGWQQRVPQISSSNTEDTRTFQSGAPDRHMQVRYLIRGCPQTYGKVLGNDVVQDMAMHVR